MTLKEAYLCQYRYCVNNNISVDCGGHYGTHIEFQDAPYFVMPDGSDVVRYRFDVRGCARMVYKKDGGKFLIHKEKLPVYGRICSRRMKRFLYKYLLFLRCDGIEDAEAMRFYLLCLLKDKCVFYGRVKGKGFFWKEYMPEYKHIKKMLDFLIEAARKKDITDEIRKEFSIVTRCVVNPVVKDRFGARSRKSREQMLIDARKGAGEATRRKIESVYESGMTRKEIARKAGVSEKDVKRWKEQNKDKQESKQERIKRMYDPHKSERENAKIIGVSINTLRKYKSVIELSDSESSSYDQSAKVELQEDTEDPYSWIDEVLSDF